MSIAFIFELNQEKSMTNENPLCIDLNENGLKRETIWRVYLFPGQVSHKWSSTVLMEIKTSSTNIGAKRLMKLPSLILNLIKLVRRGKPPHPVFPHPRVFELTDRVRHCSLIKRTVFGLRLVDWPTYTGVTFESTGTKRNIQYSGTIPWIEIFNLIDSSCTLTRTQDIEYERSN